MCGGSREPGLGIGLQHGDTPNNLFRPTFGYVPQLDLSIGWGRREIQEKASYLEKTIYFQRGKANSIKKHSFQPAYLHYVTFLAPKGCKG